MSENDLFPENLDPSPFDLPIPPLSPPVVPPTPPSSPVVPPPKGLRKKRVVLTLKIIGGVIAMLLVIAGSAFVIQRSMLNVDSNGSTHSGSTVLGGQQSPTVFPTVGATAIPSDTPLPTDTPVPPTATPVPPFVQLGTYGITITGTAGNNTFQRKGTLLVENPVHQHAIEICLYAPTMSDWLNAPSVGAINFSSNSHCLGSGSLADADLDVASVTADLPNGMITMQPDPNYCCDLAKAVNGFTESSSGTASAFVLTQGTMQLNFASGQTVTGNIDVGGCTSNPNCSGDFYIATISGQFSHP